MNRKTIKDIALQGKRVIMRADFNVPLDTALNITDDARIVKTLPTIRYLVSRGARLILMSHLGRPKGKPEKEFSLRPVAERLSELLKQKVELQLDCIGAAVEARTKTLKDGEVILLENLRFHPEEEKNDTQFAKQLANLAEVYVNDAFGAAHRAHASTEAIAHYLPALAGFLLAKEIEYFDRALENPDRPFVTILGGSKVSDKIKVIDHLLDKVDALLIGGAMAYTFLKAQGMSVGKSKVETEGVPVAEKIIRKAKSKNINLVLPIDHIVTQEISENAETQTSGTITDGWMGVDIGPKTIELFRSVLQTAKTVIWNGPVGIFEMKPFAKGTHETAQILSQLSATTIIGGGDTAAAVALFGFEDKMSHVSTGGGASLEYLEGAKLPGVEALLKKSDPKAVSHG